MDKGQVLKALMNLRASRDLDALNGVILELFDPSSGPLKSFSVSFNAARKSGFCILELRSPLTESEAKAIGGLRLGHLVCLEFPFDSDFALRSAGRRH